MNEILGQFLYKKLHGHEHNTKYKFECRSYIGHVLHTVINILCSDCFNIRNVNRATTETLSRRLIYVRANEAQRATERTAIRKFEF